TSGPPCWNRSRRPRWARAGPPRPRSASCPRSPAPGGVTATRSVPSPGVRRGVGNHEGAERPEGPLKTDLTTQLDAFLAREAAARRFTGCALVAVRGEVALHAGYGFADYAADRRNEPHHLYKTGSLTKGFVATAILMLQEEGFLRITDALDDHVPDAPH